MMRMAQTLALLEVPDTLRADAVQGAVVVDLAPVRALRSAGVMVRVSPTGTSATTTPAPSRVGYGSSASENAAMPTPACTHTAEPTFRQPFPADKAVVIAACEGSRQIQG